MTAGSPARERVAALAGRHGISDRLTFDDRRTAARLESADVFVQPVALQAGHERVLEAMAAGLPVVAPRGDDSAALVSDERTGVLVAPDDPARPRMGLARPPAVAFARAALGSAAQGFVERHHRFDAMVGAFQCLYLDGLSGASPALTAGPRAAAS